MSGLAIGLGVAFIATILVVAIGTTWYLREHGGAAISPELERQRRELVEQLARAVAEVNAGGAPAAAAPFSGEIEKMLGEGRPRRALAAAEGRIAAAPESGDAHLLLARALLYCDEHEAARHQAAQARGFGSDADLCDYLEARASYTARERELAAGSRAGKSLPTVLNPTELLFIKLEQEQRRSRRAAAIWLAGATDQTLSAEAITELLSSHFGTYQNALGSMLRAAASRPGWVEPLFHAGRLAIKVGMIERGRELLERLDGKLADSPDRFTHERELRELTDPEAAGEKLVLSAGKGRVELKVLK